MAELVRSGNRWNMRLAIPRPLRHHFPSATGVPRQKIVETLGDLSHEQAKIEASRRETAYLGVFRRLRAGEVMTAEQIRSEVHTDATSVQREVLEALHTEREKWVATLVDKFQFMPPQVVDKDATERARDEAGLRFIRETLAGTTSAMPVASPVQSGGETITQAAESWFTELQRDPSAAVKVTTLDGHKLRVRAFVEAHGDIALASITRAMASDFLTKVGAGGRSNRTVNAYATTLASVFKSARHRGRFTGDSPFEHQKRRAGGESYEAFETAALQTLFNSLPLEVKPSKHSPETALPWVSLIAAYTGMRLEEISQLVVGDIRDQGANGSTVTVIDIHNGTDNALKNAASARLVPIHSELVRAGFLDYVKALPKDGLLFPGLSRRASKGGKIGARVGELFRDKLEALGLKRDRLCFHSFRHTVGGRLEAAAVSQTDAARVLGHTIPGMSYGVYSSGPGLKRLAAVVEAIEYPGLKLPAAS
jgi:integrase